MNDLSKLLFGGAVLSAGVGANGQEFILLDSVPSASYNSYAYAFVATDTGYAETLDETAPLSVSETATSAAYGTSTAEASSTSTELLATVSWLGDGSSGSGYAGASMGQYLSVTEDAVLEIEWDFSDMVPLSAIGIEEVGADDPFIFTFFPLFGPRVGSDSVILRAGAEYSVLFAISGTNRSTGLKFIRGTLAPITCSPADLAPPSGTLNSQDLVAAITLLSDAATEADFDANGFLNFFDIIEAARLVDAGCP